MPKVELVKHTLHLRAGDFDRLSEVFAPRNQKASTIIRFIVSRYVDSLKVEPSEAELNEIKGEL